VGVPVNFTKAGLFYKLIFTAYEDMIKLSLTNKSIYYMIIKKILRMKTVLLFPRDLKINDDGFCEECKTFIQIKSQKINIKNKECYLCVNQDKCNSNCKCYTKEILTEFYCINCSVCKKCTKTCF
jgi:hypothetical protein